MDKKTAKEKELLDIGKALADVSLCDAEIFINSFEFDADELNIVLSYLFEEVRKRNYNKSAIKRNCGIPCIFAPKIMLKLAEKCASGKTQLTYGKRTLDFDDVTEALNFCQCLREMEGIIKGNVCRKICERPQKYVYASPTVTVFVNWCEPVKYIVRKYIKKKVVLHIKK